MRFPALLSLAALAVTLTSPVSAEKIRVNGIAAKANGEIVTMNELIIKLAPMQSVLMARNPRRGPAYEAELKGLRDGLLDELIDRTIIYAEYKERINAIPDHVVEEEIEKIIRNAYAGDQALFRKYLKATDLSYNQFKEQQRKEILVSVIKSQQFGDPPPPSDAEMKKEYYKWARQNRDRSKDVGTYNKIYLLKQDRFNPAVNRDDQLKLAEDIAQQIKDGADFAELAKKHSIDSMSDEGGLWKDVPRTDLNPEFGFLVFDYEGSEKLIGPIEDRNGFTIFKVVSRKYGSAAPFSKVKDRMKKIVNDQKKNAKFQEWMKKLRARVPVKKML